MITSAISSSDSLTTTVTNSNAYDMGTEDFLDLLLTELKNQDPMDPVSTSEMATQFATLTQVSQLNKTNDYLETLSHSQAVDYLGKTISYAGKNSDGTSTEKTSLVTGVVYKDSVPYLVTKDGDQVALSSVKGVS
ncbi:MAG: Basal-body rod modification protein FlgD [Syntrophus sp. PtaU1.Bin208]|nr:MAG: Basal-body rod modification protein FlgD [Syntrophus sp. PtaU1.Bin208]